MLYDREIMVVFPVYPQRAQIESTGLFLSKSSPTAMKCMQAIERIKQGKPFNILHYNTLIHIGEIMVTFRTQSRNR